MTSRRVLRREPTSYNGNIEIDEIQTNDNQFNSESLINDYDEITKHIYLGKYPTIQTLLLLNIKHVLSICEIDIQLPIGINKKYIELDDHSDSNIKTHFMSCIEFINNAIEKNENIYIHCVLGISRSPSILCAYYIYQYKIHFHDALDIIKQKRKHVNPNLGFCLQLINFADELLKKQI